MGISCSQLNVVALLRLANKQATALQQACFYWLATSERGK